MELVEYISRNPNITMEKIEKHPNKPWKWWNISKNSNITMEMIEKYPDKTLGMVLYILESKYQYGND